MGLFGTKPVTAETALRGRDEPGFAVPALSLIHI